MNSPKSNAEIQATEALTHINIMISKQSVRIEDAQYLSSMVAKVLNKCEELRKSRDNHRSKRKMVEKKIKDMMKDEI